MSSQPGKSGNPEGRPKGAGVRQQVFNALVAPHKEAHTHLAALKFFVLQIISGSYL